MYAGVDEFPCVPISLVENQFSLAPYFFGFPFFQTGIFRLLPVPSLPWFPRHIYSCFVIFHPPTSWCWTCLYFCTFTSWSFDVTFKKVLVICQFCWSSAGSEWQVRDRYVHRSRGAIYERHVRASHVPRGAHQGTPTEGRVYRRWHVHLGLAILYIVMCAAVV